MAAEDVLQPPQTVTSLSFAIKSWLQYNNDEYKGVYQTIRPSASDEAIADCEESLGFPLPPDLVNLLKVFDGQSYSKRVFEFPCAPWSRFLGCREITDRYHSLEQICEMCSSEFNTEYVWDCQVAANHKVGQAGFPILGYNKSWIPFAESYSGGGGPPTLWLLDLNPPNGVAAGRVLGFGGEGDALSLWAPSLFELLEDVLKAMKRRNPEIPVGVVAAPPEEELAEELRHRKVFYDDGPRIWHQYLNE